MTEEREAKRVRQACQNCRRKKSKCDGRRPSCSFCSRLKQQCNYGDGPFVSHHALPRAQLSMNEVDLATRVALLEAKLTLMNDISNGTNRKSSSETDSTCSKNSGDSPDSTSDALRSKFSQLPPERVLRSLLDTFFRYCQNQPYVYFREASFYRRFKEKELPEYLCMAMIALAARFSHEAFFESQQLEATTVYGRIAWNQIFDKAFADDHDLLDIHMVQATNMLAVVDFTAGRHHLGWVKIGLAVRFAQSLQLNSEPRENLSLEERDERRLTFWSVYLVDRLASCGVSRPPTIVDSDCSTLLPSDSTDAVTTVPGLRLLEEKDLIHEMGSMDPFGHTILMASALGRVERQALQQQGSNDRYPPWDSRSDFAAIYSLLLSFEGYSKITDVSFSDAINTHYFGADGSIDHQKAGHFVFSTMLYHMNQCILHHPYLFRKRLESCKAPAPLSFIREVLRRSFEHAEQLIVTVRTVQELGMAISSFYGYAVVVGGVVCRLFSYHDDKATSDAAKQLCRYAKEFLEHGRRFWGHYPKMAVALENFSPDPVVAGALVAATRSTGLSSDPSLQSIEDLLDYGWLCDPARFEFPAVRDRAPPTDQVYSTNSSLSCDATQRPHILDGESSGVSLKSSWSNVDPTTEGQMIPIPDESPAYDDGCVALKESDFDGQEQGQEDLEMDLAAHLDLHPQDLWEDFLAVDRESFLPFTAAKSPAFRWTGQQLH